MTSLRNFRDALIGVAAYFVVCAALTDPQPAFTKDIAMQVTPTAPEAVRADVAITWRHHDVSPAIPVTAVIAIRPSGPGIIDDEPVILPELYAWDADEGYWVGASNHLRLRHKEFRWASIHTLLRSAP